MRECGRKKSLIRTMLSRRNIRRPEIAGMDGETKSPQRSVHFANGTPRQRSRELIPPSRQRFSGYPKARRNADSRPLIGHAFVLVTAMLCSSSTFDTSHRPLNPLRAPCFSPRFIVAVISSRGSPLSGGELLGYRGDQPDSVVVN